MNTITFRTTPQTEATNPLPPLAQMLHVSLEQQQATTETADKVQKAYEERIAALEQALQNATLQLQQSRAEVDQLRMQKNDLTLVVKADLDRKQAKWEGLKARAYTTWQTDKAAYTRPYESRSRTPTRAVVSACMWRDYSPEPDRSWPDRQYQASLQRCEVRLQAIAAKRSSYGVQ